MLHPSPIFQEVFTALQWLAPLLLLVMLVQAPWCKGFVGRWLLHLAVWLQLDGRSYQLVRDITLPAGDGIARIDHVIVSPYGLFMAEISDVQGRIYRDADGRHWSRKLYTTRQPIPDPLHRSRQLGRSLAAALGIAEHQLFPLVVFVGDSRFKTPMPANVIHGSGYIRYIESKQRKRLSEADVERIVERLELLRPQSLLKSWLERAEESLGDVAAKPLAKHCPRCGGAMVLHSSKKFDEAGKQFWGCASFPQCKGILEVTQVPLRSHEATGRFSNSGILPSGV